MPPTPKSRKRALSSTEKLRPIDKKPCDQTYKPLKLFSAEEKTTVPVVDDTDMEAKIDQILKTMAEWTPKIDKIQVIKDELEGLRDSFEFQETQLAEACESIAVLNADVPALQMEVKELKRKNEMLEEKMLRQEEYSRRENLVFEGLRESGTKDEDCFGMIHSVLESVGLAKFQLQRCHRLGKYDGKKKRPIIARFVLFQDKISVLKKREELRGKSIIIHDDLPPEISARRARLRPVLRYLKDQGEEAFLVRDKLNYKGVLYTTDTMHTIPYDLTAMCTKITDTHVYFAGEFSPLSNLYPCKISDGNTTYIGVEQFYQKEKYLKHQDDIGAAKIMACVSNRDAMTSSKDLKVTDTWKNKDSLTTMAGILKMKFEQVPEFARIVHNNRDKVFVEATTNPTWGIGLSFFSPQVEDDAAWKGKNQMGKALNDLVK